MKKMQWKNQPSLKTSWPPEKIETIEIEWILKVKHVTYYTDWEI